MSHKPKTVLVVDDDEGMRDTLTAILKREYRVLRVASGEAALPILNREDIDLYLVDRDLDVAFEAAQSASPSDIADSPASSSSGIPIPLSKSSCMMRLPV